MRWVTLFLVVALGGCAAAQAAPPTPAPSEPEGGYRLITEPPVRSEGWLQTLLGLLRGVEVAGRYGFAKVRSHVETDGEKRTPLAEGAARQLGYQISLYKAPDQTGFFVQPEVGFLQQQIDIADFRDVIPAVELPAAAAIEATCTDVATGEKINCGAPNTYQLTMTSGYLGARIGYAVMGGWENTWLFAAASGGVNLLEYRKVIAQIADHRGETTRWARPAESMAVGATGGVVFPAIHLSVRLIFDWEYYARFQYDAPLEFKGPTAYDDDREVFYRKRSYAEDAQLSAFTFRLAAAVVF
jgi:hypothetical protein